MSPRLFWGVLAAAVLVLLGMIVRLAACGAGPFIGLTVYFPSAQAAR